MNYFAEPSSVQDETYQVFSGGPYSEGIQFSPLMKQTMDNVLVHFNETSNSDSALVTDLGNFGA